MLNPVLLLVLWALALSFLLAVGLAPPEVIRTIPPNTESRLLIDMAGRSVWLKNTPPSRVIALGHFLPIYTTLDFGAEHVIALVGRKFTAEGALERIYPRIAELPQISGVLDVERVMILAPDAVLTFKGDSAEMLEKVGLSGVFELTLPETLLQKSVWRYWMAFGQVSAKENRAQAILERYEATLPTIKTAATRQSPVRVLSLWFFNGTWSICGKTCYLTPVLELAGAANIAERNRFPLGDVEQIMKMDPDVILIGYEIGSKTGPGHLFEAPEWQGVRAVRDRRVYLMPVHSFYNWPVDIALLAGWMQEVFYPGAAKTTRLAFKDAYRDVYRYSLSDHEIDRALFIEENGKSEGYGRFK
ncbi:ABC transporter substrate-binding protein [Methylobacter sp.]|uniref:ABC transporter substrate-binding protein n=1 Tax=Methylobacter sp. TaxID=2051955 RepID=UPI002FDDA7B5